MAKQTETFFNFDITEYLAEMKVPGVDVDTVVAAQQRNFEMLNAANRLAMEGSQAIFRRQVEIMRQTMEDASSAAMSLTDMTSPSEQMAKQTELAKEAFEKNIANARELAEMMTKSTNEVIDLINGRIAASLDEFKVAIEQPAGAKPAPAPKAPVAATAAKAATAKAAAGGGKSPAAGKAAE